MPQKLRYEIDPHNRLVVGERKIPLGRFRKVLDGRFKLDENSTLSYHVKMPVGDKNIPHQFKLKGEWSLTKEHDLRLTLNKWGRQTFGDKLTFKGQIVDVRKNSLLFAFTTKTKSDTLATHILNLHGSWQADKYNRLTFKIRREKGLYDILTFNGVWNVNRKHQIVYRYEKARLIKTRRKVHTLTFQGYWDIKDKARISYVIDGSSNSVFSFNTALGLFRDKYIKYEVGIGASRTREVRTITLSGKWRIKRNVGLIFEVKYEDGKVRRMVFGAEAVLTKKDTLSFKLKNDTFDKDIGARLELSHKILGGDGEAFLRLLRSNGEVSVYAGGGLRF